MFAFVYTPGIASPPLEQSFRSTEVHILLEANAHNRKWTIIVYLYSALESLKEIAHDKYTIFNSKHSKEILNCHLI